MRRPIALPMALLAVGGALAQKNCADGLYMIVARGTGESKGSGIFGSTVAEDVADRIDDSVIEPLDYPASFSDPSYVDSEKEGVKELQEVIMDYHEACPDAKFAVLGYSQGGQVADDAFCGGAGGGFSELDALPSDFVLNYVAAIILFGDPSHVADATFNRGTSKKDGIFARDNVTFCEENYGDILRSFCDTGDTYCDRGNDTDVHGSYFTTYDEEVVDFVVERYEALKDAAGTATTTATTPASTSGSASSATGTEASATEADASATAAPSATDAPNSASQHAPYLVPVVAAVLLFAML
ncbi:hypothetical protein QQZ08_004146 [Neonectria magnoliae]|uniref:Cutinase n=1 Tax=Neonectria magnoliae TaxID=2732573 RepID=A0ABR1I8I3_9HYPO